MKIVVFIKVDGVPVDCACCTSRSIGSVAMANLQNRSRASNYSSPSSCFEVEVIKVFNCPMAPQHYKLQNIMAMSNCDPLDLEVSLMLRNFYPT